MSNCYCLHPVKIVNPKCVEFVLRHFGDTFFCEYFDNELVLSHYIPHLFGDYKCKHLKQHILRNLRKIGKFHPNISSLCTSDGECVDFFIYVPCNHCILCNHRKRVALASKCSMETQLHNNLPLFVTLTYDDEHLPDFGLCYSDVQKFLKRLRINLLRKFNFDGKLRYCVCGEYGKTTYRAHYHLLIWNFPCDKVGNLFDIDAFVRKIWSLGLTQSKRCFNSDAGFYLGKYMSKQVHMSVPSYLVQPFHRCSINLGVDFVVSVCRQILIDNPTQTDFQYCDKFDGQLKHLPLISYFIRKMFPTRNEAIPCDYRNALFDAVNQFNRYSFLTMCDYFTFELFKPLISTISRKEFYTCLFQEDWLNESLYTLARSSKYKSYDDDYFTFNFYTRTLFYGALISELENLDLQNKAKEINHNLQIEIDKEVF